MDWTPDMGTETKPCQLCKKPVREPPLSGGGPGYLMAGTMTVTVHKHRWEKTS